MSSPYSLVIFDCDGVLVDTGPVEPRVRDQLLREQGIVTDPECLTREMYGMTNEQIFAYLAANYGLQMTPDFEDRYISLCYEAFETSTRAIEGVRDVVAAVQAAGIASCVASNGPHAQMKITLRVTGLLPYFEGRVFSAYDVANPKPAPDLFLHAARTLGFAPQACVVIEDSRGGVNAGIDAGMTVLQYVENGIESVVEHERVTPFKAMTELPALLGIRA